MSTHKFHSVVTVTIIELEGNWKRLAPQFGKGNGTPLQYSCLENPMDGGAW